MDTLSKADDVDIPHLLNEIQEELEDISTRNIENESETKLKQFKENSSIFFDNPESDNSKNYNFLNAFESKKIEEDIKKMRLELKKSQEFFSTARDSLESINFENIKLRIKDLHLYPDARKVDEILQDLEENKESNIIKLTKTMSEKFKDHPGEFADLPEVSSFFKLCTQLQRGLDDLNKKKKEFDTLGKRIVWATNISENRSKDIQEILSKKEEKLQI